MNSRTVITQGPGGLKGDSLRGIGLQPRQSALVDAATSPSDGGRAERTGCKGSLPVSECLCAQTWSGSGGGNSMMEGGRSNEDHSYGVMKAGDDDDA